MPLYANCSSPPRFDIRDGLDDYDGDYTRYTPLGDTVTAHAKYHAERLRAAAVRDGPPTADAEARQPDASGDRGERSSGESNADPSHADGEGAAGDDRA